MAGTRASAPAGEQAPPPRAEARTGRYARLVRRRSGLLIIGAAALAGLSVPGVRSIDVSNPPSKYALPDDDPVVEELHRYQAVFGAQEPILIALEFGHAIAAAEFAVASRMAAQFRGLPNVAAVRIPAVEGDPGFVAADGSAVLLVIEALDAAPSAVKDLPAALRRELAQHDTAFSAARLAGLPLINEAFENHLRRDLRRYVPVAGLVAVVLLFVLYRSTAAVLVSAVAALITLALALGAVGFAGTALAMGLAMMIPLMLMLSVAYSAHYISHWLAGGGERDAVLAAMLRDVLPPSLLTGGATAAGFMGLSLSGIEGLRDTALHTAFAALAAALISATLVPALLYRFVRPGGTVSQARGGRAGAALRRLVLERPGTVVAVALVVAIVAIVGMTRVRVDANHLAYLDADTRVRRDYEAIDRNFGGVVPLETLVHVRAAAAVDAAERTMEFTARLRSVDGVGRVTSAPELAALFGLGLPDAAGWRRLAGVEGVDRLVRLHDGDTLVFRTSARVHIRGTWELARVLEHADALAQEVFGDAAVLTGALPLFVRTMAWLVRDQAVSFAVAFAAIAVLFLVLAGSWRTGAFAVAANVLPILAVFGLMGWLHVPLDFGTVMIASVLMGIAVHDTIHVIFRLRRERASGRSTEDALAATFAAVGPPVVISTFVFCGGLLVLSMSDFAPVRHFGLLATVAMLAALLADLLLLPALIARGERAS